MKEKKYLNKKIRTRKQQYHLSRFHVYFSRFFANDTGRDLHQLTLSKHQTKFLYKIYKLLVVEHLEVVV